MITYGVTVLNLQNVNLVLVIFQLYGFCQYIMSFFQMCLIHSGDIETNPGLVMHRSILGKRFACVVMCSTKIIKI